MKHIPVLEQEVLQSFDYLMEKGGYFVDGTLGAGGHSISIIKNSLLPTPYSPLKIVGIDKDESALKLAADNIKKAGLYEKFILVHDDFKNIDEILKLIPLLSKERLGEVSAAIVDDKHNDDVKISGALIDLGVSSMQLDDKSRGFSFADPDALLDMRMDKSQKLNAFDVLNFYPAAKLEKIIREYGEERFYKHIARNICKERKEKPIETVGQLISILEKSIPSKVRATSKKHFATGVFRALRLEVNEELTRLDDAIMDFITHLEKGSRLAIISFHSAEDKIVKDTFRKAEKPCTCPPLAPTCNCGKDPLVKILTRKPIIPSDQEIAENPRSRSAKLRVVERL